MPRPLLFARRGAIEEEEEGGKVEVKGEEKGLPSALSLFVLLAVVTPARGGGQEKKERKKKRWRKAALLLPLHSLIASMTGRPQELARKGSEDTHAPTTAKDPPKGGEGERYTD